MKQEIRELYSHITMPEACAQKIRRSRKSRRPLRGTLTAAAVLLVALTLSPSVLAAAAKLSQIFPGTGLSLVREPAPDGSAGTSVFYDTESPNFVEFTEGHLYFTGNGEHRDITEEISESKPFYYRYQEDDGSKITMVVGIAGSLENFGTQVFVQQPDGQWLTGAGRNFLDPATDAAYPWLGIVWQALDIPWPMPGL